MYRNGYILDLLIIRVDEFIVSVVNVIDLCLFDYLVVCCFLFLFKIVFERKEIQYCKFKFVDIFLFCLDFLNVFFKNFICYDIDVFFVVQEYNFILIGLFDKYVFVKKCVLILCLNVVWYIDDIK